MDVLKLIEGFISDACEYIAKEKNVSVNRAQVRFRAIPKQNGELVLYTYQCVDYSPYNMVVNFAALRGKRLDMSPVATFGEGIVLDKMKGLLEKYKANPETFMAFVRLNDGAKYPMKGVNGERDCKIVVDLYAEGNYLTTLNQDAFL